MAKDKPYKPVLGDARCIQRLPKLAQKMAVRALRGTRFDRCPSLDEDFVAHRPDTSDSARATDTGRYANRPSWPRSRAVQARAAAAEAHV